MGMGRTTPALRGQKKALQEGKNDKLDDIKKFWSSKDTTKNEQASSRGLICLHKCNIRIISGIYF